MPALGGSSHDIIEARWDQQDKHNTSDLTDTQELHGWNKKHKIYHLVQNILYILVSRMHTNQTWETYVFY